MRWRPTEEKFWEKVPDRPTDGCWLWTAYRNKAGYGTFGVGGTQKLAHRVAWELGVGPIPQGIKVLHHCDNPSCVNYEKCLFLGTQIENIQDMIAKGRHRSCPGERNGRAVLSAAEAQRIRRLYLTKQYTQKELGLMFGLSRSAVGYAVRGETW